MSSSLSLEFESSNRSEFIDNIYVSKDLFVKSLHNKLCAGCRWARIWQRSAMQAHCG